MADVNEPVAPEPTLTDATVDLRTLAPQLWAAKYLIVSMTLIAAAIGVAFVRSAIPTYTATIAVTAASQTPRGGAASAALGGFASLAGLGASNNATPFDLYIASLQSSADAARLSRDVGLMHGLFAAEWDPQTHSWREPVTVQTGLRNFLTGIGVALTPWRAPDTARLQAYLGRNIKVSRASGSAVTSITLSDADPRRAASLLNRVNQLADDKVRTADLARARDYIAYLRGELQVISQVDQRLAIVAILSEQQRTMMIASSSLSYAADPIEPAPVPEVPSSLSPTVVLLLFVAAGTILGCLLALTAVPRSIARWRSRST